MARIVPNHSAFGKRNDSRVTLVETPENRVIGFSFEIKFAIAKFLL